MPSWEQGWLRSTEHSSLLLHQGMLDSVIFPWRLQTPCCGICFTPQQSPAQRTQMVILFDNNQCVDFVIHRCVNVRPCMEIVFQTIHSRW